MIQASCIVSSTGKPDPFPDPALVTMNPTNVWEQPNNRTSRNGKKRAEALAIPRGWPWKPVCGLLAETQSSETSNATLQSNKLNFSSPITVPRSTPLAWLNSCNAFHTGQFLCQEPM